MLSVFIDGAVLVHANTGDLLRSLEPPSDFSSPRLLCMNREGYIVVRFYQGGLCLYGVNGKTLKSLPQKENIQVNLKKSHGKKIIGEDNFYAYMK